MVILYSFVLSIVLVCEPPYNYVPNIIIPKSLVYTITRTVLAFFAVAEFGDYDQAQHNDAFLDDCILFPPVRSIIALVLPLYYLIMALV